MPEATKTTDTTGPPTSKKATDTTKKDPWKGNKKNNRKSKSGLSFNFKEKPRDWRNITFNMEKEWT